MTRKERLMATLRGEYVDRPPVNFYEIGGFIVDPTDNDPYNVYNSASWQPVLKLAEESTDLIRMMSPVRKNSHLSWEKIEQNDTLHKHVNFEYRETEDCKFTKICYSLGKKRLTTVSKREKHLDTVWITEPLIKTRDDVITYLDLPDDILSEHIDINPLIEQEKILGDRGIVMVDTEDPLCAAAGLFEMQDFALFAYTEKDLCNKLIEKHAKYINKRTEKVAKEFPGRLWRIYGPEYAIPPLLPVGLFEEYVVQYDAPIIDTIQRYGGYARVHCHGNVKEVLPAIANMGADAIDPLEPPGQGNIELLEARQQYGDKMVLFGNIEVSDVESLPPEKFRKLVRKAINEGTSGRGRGFVLMPSSSPFGRDLSQQTVDNYKIMVEEVNN